MLEIIQIDSKLAARHFGISNVYLFGFEECFKTFCASYHNSGAIINYLDKYTCEDAVLTLVTFMTLKMTLKSKIDNDIHPFLFCHPMND